MLCSSKEFLSFAALLGLGSARSIPRAAASTNVWDGWANIKDMFIFGDSYTTTGFNATTGPQPNSTDPLGNPPYPGNTASDGPNWVDFLTTTYNKSRIETYNLAYGGATVDSALVAQYLPTVLDLKQQIENEFLPIYGNKTLVPWKAATSLFAIWIGINDVGNSYQNANATSLRGPIFEVYNTVVDELYTSGARNFLFINVPPVDRSPGTIIQGPNVSALEKKAISTFNAEIKSLVTNVTRAHEDVAAFLFDSNTLFSEVLDNPKTFPETAGYKNTTNYCFAYENGTATMTQLNASCIYPVNEYFWLNTLHPTYPMHNETAKQISMMLDFSIPV